MNGLNHKNECDVGMDHIPNGCSLLHSRMILSSDGCD